MFFLPGKDLISWLSAFLGCLQFFRLEDSWAFLIHISMAVTAVLVQLMFMQTCWWEFIGAAFDIRKQYNLTTNSLIILFFESFHPFISDVRWTWGVGVFCKYNRHEDWDHDSSFFRMYFFCTAYFKRSMPHLGELWGLHISACLRTVLRLLLGINCWFSKLGLRAVLQGSSMCSWLVFQHQKYLFSSSVSLKHN